MEPLFSKVDSNKLWRDVQHEENVICAKSGKDMFNISKVRSIGRKSGTVFLTHSVCDFQLVINSNFDRRPIFYRFRDNDV